MEDTKASLEAEFCPPLDPTAFLSILSDFDLDKPNELGEVRIILESIRATAVEEADSGFDPTGLTVTSDARSPSKGRSEATESSFITDPSSLSTGFRSLEIDSGDGECGTRQDREEFLEEMAHIDLDSKALYLHEAVPTIPLIQIKLVLTKCDGNFSRALDELLNHSHFNSDEFSNEDGKLSTKGIDAFSEDNIHKRGRQKRRKVPKAGRIPLIESAYSPSPSSSPAPAKNAWTIGKEDIDFVAKRMGLSETTVATAYNKSGRSRGKTVESLLADIKASNSALAEEQDHAPELVDSLFKLIEGFPEIQQTDLAILLKLTQPSFDYAHDLAVAIIDGRRPRQDGQLHVIANYKPIDSRDEQLTAAQASKAKPAVWSSSGDQDAALVAQNYQSRLNRALTQASAAYRRGRSDRLMMAAASHYSEESRKFAALAREASGSAADELVSSQSTVDQIDLHGVTVKDAQRISLSKVQDWERRRGVRVKGLDGRIVIEGSPTTSNSFRIITGLGRHSAGGQSKLGPAVRKLLDQGGYKYSYDEGVFTVHGRRG